MRKRDEVANPDSCLNRARDEDFVFVLKDTDPAMVDTIRFWVEKRIALGKNRSDDPKIKEALNLANEVRLKRLGTIQ